tara:strand:- start:354 stop:602 length:249 start_codon:yes stop_codon:yes gene_type:complete
MAIALILTSNPDISLTELTIEVNKRVTNKQSYTGTYSRTTVEKAIPYARTLNKRMPHRSINEAQERAQQSSTAGTSLARSMR